MQNRFSYLLFIATFLIQAGCVAQDRELANVGYNISKVRYNDTSANERLLDIKVRLPFLERNKNSFLIAVAYKGVVLSGFPESYTKYLHGISLQAIWLHKFNDRSSLALFAQTGLFSDMKEVSGKDFRYGAGFRYRHRYSAKLATGWGLAYSRQFFGNQIVPFIDVDYKPSEQWSISGQFPVKPKVLYHFNKKVSAGMELNGEAASYRLSPVERNNQFIQINQWAGLARLEYQFARAWQLNLGIGRNFRQSFRLYQDASTTPWTIITIPLAEKSDPIKKIDSKGLSLQLGVSLSPFGSR